MHFISGLPWSGSTLLAALLRHQRPAILRAIFREHCATTKAGSGIRATRDNIAVGRISEISGYGFLASGQWEWCECLAPQLPSSWLGHVAPADV